MRNFALTWLPRTVPPLALLVGAGFLASELSLAGAGELPTAPSPLVSVNENAAASERAIDGEHWEAMKLWVPNARSKKKAAATAVASTETSVAAPSSTFGLGGSLFPVLVNDPVTVASASSVPTAGPGVVASNSTTGTVIPSTPVTTVAPLGSELGFAAFTTTNSSTVDNATAATQAATTDNFRAIPKLTTVIPSGWRRP